ncbi:HDIG domain-containing protein [Paenibacillus sp. UNCCL117]|uniref:HD-GYP domain-containing protein n=1 Tax=unclassified Paenibacillus TaxID=185978 RepID=UPI0008872425|nr:MULTISPECIES: HD-GYP domain-containing protein [unclassified Paenibacillus]SDC07131.1 HDIG domain-containing protein [Paenibacillus sp. cl123]SFW37973.1 HDIG domain-containing protein [Paenibacillus sp. UNCCL117]
MRIPINEIKIGDRLGSDVFNHTGLLVLSAATVLSEDDIFKLSLHHVDEVDIKPGDEKPSSVEERQDNRQEEAYALSNPGKNRLAETRAIYQGAVSGIKSVFEQVAADGYVSMEQINEGFNPLVEQVHQEKDVVSLLLVLNNKDDYTYQHSVQVGMISYYIAKWMGQPEDEAVLAGKAGYLHDIGKSRVDQRVLTKPGRLTDEEYLHIKQHTVFGYDILKKSGLPEGLCLAALQHHERMDGTGYPLRLKGPDIHPLAKIIAVADVYSAMISTRVYQKKRDLLSVLREIHRCSFGELEPHIAHAFIKHMVPNFIGKQLQLSTGEIGKIVMTHPTDFFRPLVNFDGHFIDLSLRQDLGVEHIFV